MGKGAKGKGEMRISPISFHILDLSFGVVLCDFVDLFWCG